MTLAYSTILTISIDGQASAILRQNLLSMDIKISVDEPARCEMSIENWGSHNGTIGYLFFDRALIDFGKTLEVRFGAQGSQILVFNGRINTMEAKFPNGEAPYITVLAEDHPQIQEILSSRTAVFGYNYGANLREFTVLANPAGQKVGGKGIIEADPHLRVGVTANLLGLGPIFSGNYSICGLRHLFDRNNGLRTEVSVERPW